MSSASEPDLRDVFDEPGSDSSDANAGFGSDGDTDSPFKETAPTEAEERRPQRVEKRTSAKDLISMIWGGAGMALAQSGADVPVGRVMQFQAPLAGDVLDKMLANTMIDKWIQPLVKSSDNMEGIGSLILFPLLVAAYERNPAAGVAIEPILRQVVRSNLVDLAPVMKKRQAEEKRAARAMADISGVLDLEPDESPVDAILASIFAPIPTIETEPEGATDGV